MESESTLIPKSTASQPESPKEEAAKVGETSACKEPISAENRVVESPKPAPTSSEVVDGDFLTAPQLARKLNVSLKAIRKWSLSGRLMYVKMGRLVRYYWPEIEKRLLTGRLLSEKE
ncbi:MAG TPA: helix-turn-helix domain-containing protein [Chitinivibrionales bacterium]|nr:helix-turn-helix domain-containing protein [Chitinivibrionales bacterium]